MPPVFIPGGLTVSTPYTPDVTFYHMNDDYDKVILKSGEFVILFPGEAHAPCLDVNGKKNNVRKMVIKVLA